MNDMQEIIHLLNEMSPYLLLGFLLQAVLPVMQRQRWLPEQLPGGRLRW